MIVVDIETSGLSPKKNGIVSLGALFFDDPETKFYQECRLDDEDEANGEAMKINGMDEVEMRNPKKQSQKELIEKFFRWVERQKIKILAGHNVGFFDLNFLKAKAEKYGIELKTRYRSFDLCSVAQTRHYQIHGEFLLDDYQENAMGLTNVLKFCGIPDERIKFDGGKLLEGGRPHNAFEDAVLEAECFSRLLNGKGMFPKYEKFPVPDYLRGVRRK